MRCPRCAQENPPQAKFCLECATPLTLPDSHGESRNVAERLAEALRREQEAREQQAATSDILRVISGSPSDVQPVFDTIAMTALRLCEAKLCTVFRFDGTLIHLVAGHHVATEGAAAYRDVYPAPPGRAGGTHRAILTRRIVHIPDIREDPEYELTALARANDFGCVLAVPMFRDGQPIGAITVGREAGRGFADEQIDLLKTFADQAVIAIENVRLFTELQEKNQALTQAHAQVTESLEQQTATSEILRVISSSPTDVQPVFDAIVTSVARLCSAMVAVVCRLIGDELHLAAQWNTNPEWTAAARREYPIPAAEGISGLALRERRVVHVPDINADERFPFARRLARTRGYRSIVFVPMLHDGVAVGTIGVGAPAPFSENQIALLKTFADQAVIAIENVRLFTELQGKNLALTNAHAQVSEALEQQTATAEILRVISGSPTELAPVFDAILASACRLCGANFAALWRVSGDELVGTASYNASREFAEHMKSNPLVPSRQGPTRLAALERRTVHIADMTVEPGFSPVSLHFEKARTVLSVPLLHDGALVGVLSMWRREVRPFTEQQIALVQTFADQAVIAIENVRLFKELEARTHELTRSVGELRALGEVGQAISSTLDLQAVLSTIVARAAQLSGTDAGVIYEYDEPREVFLPRATEHLETEIVETMLATPVRKGEGATGRLAEVQEPVQVPDILAAPAESRVRGALVRAGYRALLAVPLVREGRLLGGLTVIRKATGAFAPEVIELLQTFATQSALAIQNARLFLEVEDKSRQLEIASQHKSEFLANMSHELRTPLNAIIGFSEVLSERMFGELNEKQDEYLKDIHTSGQHLLSLINDILDLSKIEAGRMELERTNFHLPATLDNSLTLIRERAGRRGIALHMTVDAQVGYVEADERKIKQVVLNLLSNAIKFTPEGGRIEVRAMPVDGSIEVSVSDTGVGIAPEDQDAIFEEFKQVGTAAKKVEGTGLGLALSRKFIELHGGRIWVKSELGAGSTFAFTIPVHTGA